MLSIFPSFEVGGAQVRFTTLANFFGARIRHKICAINGNYSCTSLLHPGLAIETLKLPIRKADLWATRRQFREVLRDKDPDVMLTHNWGSMDWVAANFPAIVPHVHIEDGFGVTEAKRQLLRRVVARNVLLRNSTVVVPSRTLEHIAKKIWLLPTHRVAYIPNGVDIEKYSIRRRSKLDDVPAIGTVAVLRPEKNLPRLLQAFRLVRSQRPCRLIIAGSGPEREKLEVLAREAGIAESVEFTGYRTDTENIYASLDVFVLSSDTEQMPTSILEAMAAGLPIVATDVGDVRTLVSAENNPFIVNQDAGDIARGVISLLDSPEMRDSVGKANSGVARKQYSQGNMFRAYASLLQLD